MCNPLLIAAGAAVAAGSYEQAQGANAQDKAQAAATNRETASNQALRAQQQQRNAAMVAKNQGVVTQAEDNNSAAKTQQNEATDTAARQSLYAQTESGITPYTGAATAPTIVDSSSATQLAKALSSVNRGSAARAALGGMQDANVTRNTNNADTAGQIALTNNEQAGSNSVLPVEENAARQQYAADSDAAKFAGSGARLIGGALQQGGMLLGSAGLGSAAAPAVVDGAGLEGGATMGSNLSNMWAQYLSPATKTAGGFAYSPGGV